MSNSQEVSKPVAETTIADYAPSQLEIIRPRMVQGHAQGDWYLAGELESHPFYPYDFDQRGNDTGNYEFYVAPLEPKLEPAALNRFTHRVLGYFSNFAVKMWQSAEEYPDGSMDLPWAEFAEETVGERTIETVVTVASFAGPRAAEEPKVEENTRTLPITETTRVRVFPDSASARVLFDYGVMVNDGTLDTRSPDRYGVEQIHRNHSLEGYQLAALIRWHSKGRPAWPKIKKVMGMIPAT